MFEIGGVELLPPWPIFLSFAIAGLALNLVPGADMAFVVASAARGGRRAGVLAAFGIGAGALVHVAAAVLGISALLASSQTAFNLLKWFGAAYLLYVAFSIIRSGGMTVDDCSHSRARSGWTLFRSAALVNILNPKVGLFFLAFLPQFTDPEAAVPAIQILCLGLWFDFVGTLVNIAVAVTSAKAAVRLAKFAWVARIARWLAGTLIAALAIKLAVASRERALT